MYSEFARFTILFETATPWPCFIFNLYVSVQYVSSKLGDVELNQESVITVGFMVVSIIDREAISLVPS